MRSEVLLADGWQVRSADYQRHTSRWAAPERYETMYIPATVPGDVHLDYMRAGQLADPFVGLNTDACLWMEQTDFWYRHRFALPKGWGNGKQTAILLRFEGLDCFATVYLDGKKIGEHANMFTPLELDITARVQSGKTHTLEVRLAAPLFEAIQRHPDQYPVATTWGFPRHISRKAQMSYGWDIAPRLVTTGIWRPVKLILVDRARIENVWIRTRKLTGDPARNVATSARMQAQITVDSLSAARRARTPLTLELEIQTPGGGDRTVLRKTVTASVKPGASQTVTFDWTVKDPQLWWPNGSGDPKLYTYTVRLNSGDELLDEKQHHFGIRTVRLDRTPIPKTKTKPLGHRYAFVINGREIFMRGWNWTPPDAIFARITDDRRAQLVQAVRNSHSNMLRVWGGGYYEPEAFFDLCDRAGLLVHQDFMMACALYPQSAAFQAELRAEAEYIVKQYRSHPSIALWSGDNECDAMYENPSKNVLTRKTLPAVVKQLDPDTPYIPSSPDSPANRVYNDLTDSDVHLWWHGQDYRHEFFTGVKAQFVSEIGFLSLPGPETANRFLGGAPGWPADNPVWDHHAADCMRGKFFRGMAAVLKNFQVCGKKPPKNLDEYIRVSQELQAEAYRTWALHFGKMPECAGILLWNLADCWPQMSDAVIAWPWDEKPALQAAAEAFGQIGRW